MQLSGANMIKTTEELKEELSSYSDPLNKIRRMIKEGKLFPIVKGVYETNPHPDRFTMARYICSPSYISFESALCFHGMIPERVNAITSASLGNKKNKIFTNRYATFTFSDIPERVFPLGIMLVKLEGIYSFQIATKEKALCDKLYKMPVINNYKELEITLFDDLRIDEETLNDFNLDDMKTYSNLYHSKSITILYKYLRRKKHDNSN